jgi:hypothetical protein
VKSENLEPGTWNPERAFLRKRGEERECNEAGLCSGEMEIEMNDKYAARWFVLLGSASRACAVFLLRIHCCAKRRPVV